MEYRMFNTYDVHFYASFALASLFPLLEGSLTRDFARSVMKESAEVVSFLHSGTKGTRKVAGTIPHDLGGPTESPWEKVNIYCIHDPSRWKDLPLKFILTVYRDYLALGCDLMFLADMWPSVKQVYEMVRANFVKDGMVVNESWPDQTYDAWVAEGVTAYCGGLWLAALRVMETVAKLLGEDAQVYEDMLKAAQTRYEALWSITGGYYRYASCSKSSCSDSIMADQCCGEWYLRLCGLEPVLPKNHTAEALRKVHRYNVRKFASKRGDVRSIGAVNGMKPDGEIDTSSMQSMECWVGTTFAVASHMVAEGLVHEGFETASGIYEGVYQQFGFWFSTPEAWLVDGSFRSLGYMRALAVWAVQWAHNLPQRMIEVEYQQLRAQILNEEDAEWNAMLDGLNDRRRSTSSSRHSL
eukprot:Sspe_Gene.40853::Locus_19733_Transcript_1_1_Confidence_1.000_Length_2747::g.40853::m.40853/K17108/GBA2; non-lysosomal glucosylceramidase